MTSLDHENRTRVAAGKRPSGLGRPLVPRVVPFTTGAEAVAHRWRAFALLAVAFIMTIIDLTIVNVALPTIGRKLHFAESDLQWVVSAYGLTFGGFLLLGGRAADLLGRRRLFMTGVAIFRARPSPAPWPPATRS
jgi:hypothetical protein